MSFGHHTPESLLARADSKNPATTCKGLTSAGRPCRRALATHKGDSPAVPPDGRGNGVVAILDQGDAAAFFCWQHKDQAEVLVAQMNERTQVLPLKQKSSIDTLIERIGVLELEDEVGNQNEETESREHVQIQHETRRQFSGGLRKRDTLPHEWQRIRGPLMSVPEEIVESQGYRKQEKFARPQRRHTSERMPRSNVKASWSCCIRADDEDLPPPRRRDNRYDRQRSRNRRERPLKPTLVSAASPNQLRYRAPSVATPNRRKPANNPEMQQQPIVTVNYPQLASLPNSPVTTPNRPTLQSRTSTSPPNFQTAALLSLIPTHLSPTTTSALLTELTKPISIADDEGYIYMFWLTPESDTSKPDEGTASSLLDGDDFTPTPSPARLGANNKSRRKSELDRRQMTNNLTREALQRFASIKHSPTEPKKILLKIGRASNVHRRLSQWTKQCGQNITLIRYYPYHPQGLTQSSSPASTEFTSTFTSRRTVPHVHRVERLIHIELAAQRAADKGKCESCGREHKEWFEVEATREGVRAVDEIVRRWVGWGERMES